MSRYYDIALTAASGSTPVQGWTSYPNGQNDPGALQIELDLLTAYFGIPTGEVGNSSVTIWGVPLTDIWAAAQFSNLFITIRGGMKPGLPLATANAPNSGVLASGQIFQSFSNWTGTDMNITFVITQSYWSLQKPGNFVFTWLKGTSLGSAILNALQGAYAQQPAVTIATPVIANTYVADHDVHHIVLTLNQFAQFIYRLTKGKVQIAMTNNTVYVNDGSQPAKAKALLFTDLIGQPKWVDQAVMQFTTVMRGDLNVGSTVTMPKSLQDLPGIVTVAAASSPSQLNYRTSFQGNFSIISVRHVGNFRDPNPLSWASIFNARPLTQPTAELLNAG